jgi:hypothetical protein
VLTLAGNARITGNSAFEGGGIFLYKYTSVVITGAAAITGNYAYGEGGGMYMDVDTITPAGVSASSVYGNTSAGCANFYRADNTTCVLP